MIWIRGLDQMVVVFVLGILGHVICCQDAPKSCMYRIETEMEAEGFLFFISAGRWRNAKILR